MIILPEMIGSVVDTNYGANHLREDDHVAQVSLDADWLLALGGVAGLLGIPQTLQQTPILAGQTVLEPSASAGVDELDKLRHRHDDELLEVDTTVGVLTESGTLLWCCIPMVILAEASPC